MPVKSVTSVVLSKIKGCMQVTVSTAAEQRLLRQYLYSCTSKTSTLSTKLGLLLVVLRAAACRRCAVLLQSQRAVAQRAVAASDAAAQQAARAAVAVVRAWRGGEQLLCVLCL
jgi:hypothetical protein